MPHGERPPALPNSAIGNGMADKIIALHNETLMNEGLELVNGARLNIRLERATRDAKRRKRRNLMSGVPEKRSP